MWRPVGRRGHFLRRLGNKKWLGHIGHIGRFFPIITIWHVGHIPMCQSVQSVKDVSPHMAAQLTHLGTLDTFSRRFKMLGNNYFRLFRIAVQCAKMCQLGRHMRRTRLPRFGHLTRCGKSAQEEYFGAKMPQRPIFRGRGGCPCVADRAAPPHDPRPWCRAHGAEPRRSSDSRSRGAEPSSVRAPSGCAGARPRLRPAGR